ncbi:MAG: hypothetical protein AABZ06_04000 [Bdellovibrionota bacterium]
MIKHVFSAQLILLLVFLTSCQRLPLRRDQDAGRDVADRSYYSEGKGRSAEHRLETFGQPKKRVAVLEFWNSTPVQLGEAGLFGSKELKHSLTATKRIVVLPEDAPDPNDSSSKGLTSGSEEVIYGKFDTVLKTSDIVHGDKINVVQLVREGRRLGVAAIVIGRISKVVFRQNGDEVGLLRQKQSAAYAEVEIKVFDVSSGRELMALSRLGEAQRNAILAIESDKVESPEYRGELIQHAIRDAIRPLIPEVIKSVEKLSWQGRVAKIAGQKLFVNAGRVSGIIMGDILKVLTPGEDIYDQATSTFIGRSKGQMKGTLEIIDFVGSDGAVAKVHTGGNFQEGDVLQLY